MGACTLVHNLVPGSTLVMPAGTIKRVHVNQHILRANKKNGTKNSVVTVQWRNKSYCVRVANISGQSQVIYSHDKPLSCGARVWVETKSEVVVVV